MSFPFQVALTGDFFDASGRCKYTDIGLSVLEAAPHIAVSRFPEHRPEIGADQVGAANGIIVLTPQVTKATVSSSAGLLAIGRFGVGYDSVDVPACTAADVAVFITSGAVDRPVAEAAVGWMIALTHHVRVKDRLVRTGAWDARSGWMGVELRDRTLGLVGCGGIARELVRLLSTWGMKPPLAFDPYLSEADAAKAGVRRVELDELLRSSDFVSVHCPLTEKTRGLIGAPQFALMRPGSYLLNTARGGIVDETALYDALKSGRLAGAALDCFAQEPVTTPPRLAELDNIILAPHCIAWTQELFRDIGRADCQGMLDLSLGRRPRGVINPEVFDRRGFQEKWARLRNHSS